MTVGGRVTTVLRAMTLAAIAAGAVGCGSGDNTSKVDAQAFSAHPDAKSIPPPPADAMKPPASQLAVPPHAMGVGGEAPPNNGAPPPGAMPGGPPVEPTKGGAGAMR